jgi:hypothetical protein
MYLTYNTLSDNNSILAVWNAHYFAINQTNMIIKFVPSVPGATLLTQKK